MLIWWQIVIPVIFGTLIIPMASIKPATLLYKKLIKCHAIRLIFREFSKLQFWIFSFKKKKIIFFVNLKEKWSGKEKIIICMFPKHTIQHRRIDAGFVSVHSNLIPSTLWSNANIAYKQNTSWWNDAEIWFRPSEHSITQLALERIASGFSR